jgi:hypothetical protein
VPCGQTSKGEVEVVKRVAVAPTGERLAAVGSLAAAPQLASEFGKAGAAVIGAVVVLQGSPGGSGC